MEWYWWVLIAVGVVVIGSLKLKLFKAILARKAKQQPEEEDI